MGDTDAARVIVGVDASLSGLRALRCAVAEARRRQCILVAVRVLRPVPAWSPDLVQLPGQDEMSQEGSDRITREAFAYIARAFGAAFVDAPRDVRLQLAAPAGAVGLELVRLAAREDDLLVVGSRQPTLLGRISHGATVKHCLRHASCPVLVVPPHALAKTGTTRALSHQLVREASRLVDMSIQGEG